MDGNHLKRRYLSIQVKCCPIWRVVTQPVGDTHYAGVGLIKASQDTVAPHTPIPAQSGLLTSDTKPTLTGLLTPTTEGFLELCPRFRLLIIGKRPAHEERGKANIETPLYSELNEHFVLHDSNGFEPGENNNLADVKRFIERRKTHSDVNEQLHAVWLFFQVPVELIETGMEELLRDKSSILGNIPTIFVFTKYDMLTEAIERRWVLEKKDYTEEQLNLEADQYLKQHYIKCIQELTGRNNIPYIAVSSSPRYKDTLKWLAELTHEKVSEYFVPQNTQLLRQYSSGASAVAVVTAIAQRVATELHIAESINVGKRRFWKAFFSGANLSGHTIQDCLNVIHTDIVKVWNFYDPSGLVDTLDGRRRYATSVRPLAHVDTSTTIAGNSGPLVALVPIFRPFIASSAVIKWARDIYNKAPEVQRRFIAYTTDLTHVLDILFTLSASRSENNLTIKVIKVAIIAYQTSQRKMDVHNKVKGLSFKLIGGCDVPVEMESLVKSRYIADNDLKQKVEVIMPAELEGEQYWEYDQALSNLDEMIALNRQKLERRPWDVAHFDLAGNLCKRYSEKGQIADLDEAISLH
ncbi:hypothetical protein V8B97DRAFT_2087741 [Scleroderma yunnanense]